MPRWLRAGVTPLRLEQRLFRTEPSAIPAGMATRVVVADSGPDSRLRISLHADPASHRVCWLLIGGPFVLRRFVRVRRGLCPACAYPMGGSGVCSECGKALAAGRASRRIITQTSLR